ncbi:MAG: AAA family ATPase [Eubacterium sp.]|nr:AAA family ATPase [Eubacterium sp.]
MENRHSLVIIDSDYEYVRSIEPEIIRKYAEKVDVQIITDEAYIEKYFSEPRAIDVLIIDEHNYGEYLKNHEIHQTFLMLPEIDIERSVPRNVSVLVKYLPESDLYQTISDAFARIDLEAVVPEDQAAQHETRVVAVYSPIGGCGKSLISIGLARKLKMLDQKVLLIGCDDVQSFSVFGDMDLYADPQLAEELCDPDEDTYWMVLQNLAVGEVTYLKPFDRAPHAMGVGRTQWRAFVTMMKEKGDFDYLILDIGSRVDEAGRELMNKADEIVLITEPNLMATKKVQRIAGDTEMLPQKKCFLISNEYHGDGMRFAEDAVFDQLAAYRNWVLALEDPMFYRLALGITDANEKRGG